MDLVANTYINDGEGELEKLEKTGTDLLRFAQWATMKVEVISFKYRFLMVCVVKH